MITKQERYIIMKNDPFHLFSKKEKASLGILSVARNFGEILSKDLKKVNEIFVWNKI